MSPLQRSAAAIALALSVGTASAAGLGPSNLLVSDLQAGLLYEYTPQGALVQQFAAPDFTGGFHDLRDIATGPDGRVHMYNGTFAPALTTLDPVSGELTSRQAPGWSTINNTSYGGIGVWHESVFVTDMRTAGDGDTGGIVRFDMNTRGWSRLSSPIGIDYTDLSVGLDGLLYALGGGIDVFDPASGAYLRSIFPANFNDVRGIAVDSAGTIFTADWDGVISRYNAAGGLLGTRRLTGESLTDIDVNSSGQIVVGSRFGHVYLTDASLQSLSSFEVGNSLASLHVAFAQPVPEPSGLALMLVGLGASGLWRLARRSIRA